MPNPTTILPRLPLAAVLAAVLAALLVGACSVLPERPPVTTYDFGPSLAAPVGGTSVGALRVLPTDGPAWLDGTAIHYRLRYAQAERLQPYATQRWIMSPVRLFDERLRDAVSARGELARGSDPSAPALRVELLDFEQIFDRAEASRGVVRARATVIRNGQQMQKVFSVEQPAPTADGAGGVHALAAASDALIAAIVDWVAALPKG